MTKTHSHVQLGLVDLDGVIRGKYLSKDKFDKIRESGSAFCSVVFGWDLRDELYENDYTGWNNGFPDDDVRVAENTKRNIPETGQEFHLIEFTGKGAYCCPRRLAGRILERAADMGFEIMAGFEYEAFAFAETVATAQEKGFRDLVPLTASTGGYSFIRQNVHEEFFTGLLSLSEGLDTPIEALHPEAGAGAIEFALSPSQGIEVPDRAAILKTFSKIWAQKQGISLCYMAKPALDLPGCGGHLHMSLKRNKTPVFFDTSAEWQMSETARYFLGGQQRYMAELLAMTAPTVNSFTRLTPGYWAPTWSSWGLDNRTCALRVVGTGAGSRRVEYRVTSADANPYLVFAAALASGLAGIENRIEPTAPVTGNAYDDTPPKGLAFPATLGEAAEGLRGSDMARTWFGDNFVEHFSKSRIAEEQKYRAHVSDWELTRYFEMI